MATMLFTDKPREGCKESNNAVGGRVWVAVRYRKYRLAWRNVGQCGEIMYQYII